MPDLIRATTDRPDEVSGSMIHVIYATPSDGPDHHLDTNGVLENSIGAWQSWLSLITGGRRMNIDTAGGRTDITFATLPRTDATYLAKDSNKLPAIEQDLSSQGFITPGKKYLVYYEGSNNLTCGESSAFTTAANGSPIGQVAIIYLNGVIPGFVPCGSVPMAAHPLSFLAGYQEYAAIHEIVHLLGGVSENAPHSSGSIGDPHHVDDDSCDLMYYSSNPCFNGGLVTLDTDHQDYFNPNGPLPPGTFNLAQSPFLLPAAP